MNSFHVLIIDYFLVVLAARGREGEFMENEIVGGMKENIKNYQGCKKFTMRIRGKKPCLLLILNQLHLVVPSRACHTLHVKCPLYMHCFINFGLHGLCVRYVRRLIDTLPK
jgi:hypothetical protein